MTDIPSAAPIAQLAVLAISSSLSPGPNNLLLATCAARFGARRTWPTAIGMYAGFCLMLLGAGLGLAGLIERAPALLRLLQIGGAAYLAYLAVGLVGARWTASAAAAPPGFARATALQFLNPKLWLMTLSTISLCATPGGAGPSVPLVACFVLMTVPSMLLYVKLGALVHRLSEAPRTRSMANRTLALLTAGSALLMLAPAVPG